MIKGFATPRLRNSIGGRALGRVQDFLAGFLELFAFKATNPSNKLEDVNTIKQFCDAVNSNLGGDAPTLACKLLAHKIQSPQEREALQALAVLEACVKSCGPIFHSEVGKFKFLNEMIKLVSPKYLVNL